MRTKGSDRGSRSNRGLVCIANLNWQAPLAPIAWICLERTNDLGAARAAPSVAPQPPQRDFVPVSADYASPTVGAIGAPAGFVVHVTRVDVIEPGLARYVTRHLEGMRRSGRHFEHLVVRMKGREVQWDIWAQLCHHPFA